MKYRRQGKIPALEIEDENGNVICTAEINGDFFRLRNAINAKLGKIEKLRQNDAEDEELGGAIVELMKAVYGNENADKIVAAFEDNVYEMILCISQHIQMDVLPALDKIVKKEAESIKQMR